MILPRLARSVVLASTAVWSLAGFARAAEPVPLEAPRRAAAGGVVEVAPEPEKSEKKEEKKRVKALVKQLEATQAVRVRQATPAATADAGADVQDPRVRLMLLTAGGPLLVETSFTLDGQPFRAIREKLLDEMIAAADSDKDGKPTWKEAFATPRFFSGRFLYASRNEQQREQLTKAYDTNTDGIVDRNEARLVMSQSYGGGSFNLQPGFNGAQQADIRQLLDTDKDGSLSTEEMAAAGARLKSRDANDNDLIELNEIGGGGQGNPYQRQVLVNGAQPVVAGQVAIVLGPGSKADVLFDMLKKKYAGDKPFTADRFPLVPKLVESLDANKNGELEAEEAAGLLTTPAHIVLEANFGKTGDLPLGLTLKSLAEELGSPEKLVQKNAEVTVVTLPGLKLELSANTQQQQFVANFEASAKQMIDRFDTDKNGYIEKKELGDGNQGFAQQFDGWDQDSDGKVFLAEIKEFYEKQYAPQLSQVNATAAELGSSIFSTLDASGDGRLSLREMRMAGERMKKYDADADGKVTLSEIPGTLSVSFGRGYAFGYGRSAGVGRPAVQPNGAPAASAGPAWFARMDRNGDGDVTPREFLGTSEQFQKLDVDGDGFLTKEEAEKADKGTEPKPEVKQAEPEKQTQPAPAS